MKIETVNGQRFTPVTFTACTSGEVTVRLMPVENCKGCGKEIRVGAHVEWVASRYGDSYPAGYTCK